MNMTGLNYENIRKLSPCWKRKDCLLYPENPKVPAIEHWENIVHKNWIIIRHFASNGDLLYTNEDKYGYKILRKTVA